MSYINASKLMACNSRVMQGDQNEKQCNANLPKRCMQESYHKTAKNIKPSAGLKEPYYACPYCLTEITLTETEKDDTLEKPSQNQEKLSDCKHYFGYMSEKEHKQEMPEECMLCSRIIDCMIKKNGPTKEKTD
jgi:hypothetical protein